MKPTAMLCLVLLAASAVMATTVIPMSVEELTRAANAVVEARAADTWSAWNPQHTLIYTYTRFQTVKALRGSLPEVFVVKQPGGVVGNDAVKVPGVRQFQSGETTLLFVRPSEAQDGTHVVVGLMQGNFRMYRTAAGEMAVTNGVRGVSALQSGAVREFSGSSMSLRDMEVRIEATK